MTSGHFKKNNLHADRAETKEIAEFGRFYEIDERVIGNCSVVFYFPPLIVWSSCGIAQHFLSEIQTLELYWLNSCIIGGEITSPVPNHYVPAAEPSLQLA